MEHLRNGHRLEYIFINHMGDYLMDKTTRSVDYISVKETKCI